MERSAATLYVIGYRAESQSFFFLRNDGTWDRYASISQVKIYQDEIFAKEAVNKIKVENHYPVIVPYKEYLAQIWEGC